MRTAAHGLILALCLGLASPMLAQDASPSMGFVFREDFHQDSLHHEFHPEINPIDCLFLNYIPSVDQELVEDRASCLQDDFPLVVNETVCGFIHYFTVRRRGYTRTMLERKNFYFPIFEYYLRQYEMPDVLKHLAIVESGLNYSARSPAGAVGLWQFMPGTGREFKLNQTSHIDERQNPWLATQAACKYLKSLYGMFKDWELALAAYNCGPGNVLKAQRRSGKTGFWEIYPNLPKETRSYVPQFYAVVYSMRYAREHNIFPDINNILTATSLDTFRLQKSCNLFKLEQILGLSPKTLLQHNPELKSSFFPGGTLLIPETHSGLLAANLDLFLDSAKQTVPVRSVNYSAEELKNSGMTSVFLKKGTDLRKAAKKYGLSYAAFCKINHVKGHSVRRGRAFLIPGRKQEETAPEQQLARKDTSSQKASAAISAYGKLPQITTAAEVKNEPLSTRSEQEKSVVNEKGNENSQKAEVQEFHQVQKGDGLYTIARKYGISLSHLIELNPDLGKHIFLGQKIRITRSEKSADDSSAAIASKQNSKSSGFRQIASSAGLTSKEKAQVKPQIYKVQKGDTIYSITRKFNRISLKELIKINKIKNNQIKPGQHLIIG